MGIFAPVFEGLQLGTYKYRRGNQFDGGTTALHDGLRC